jgi:predicted outer membrane protein
MRTRNRKILLLAVGLASTAGCKAREEPRGIIGDTLPPTPAAEQLSDGNVVAFLARATETAISMARVAEPRARSGEVREYAQRAREEHTVMQRQLDSVAAARSIMRQAPIGRDVVDAEMAQRADALLTTPDAAFDSAYVSTQRAVDGHFLENVTRFASAASDEQLRILLRSWIPTTQARITKGVGLQRSLSP